jgi:hypothetical protein
MGTSTGGVRFELPQHHRVIVSKARRRVVIHQLSIVRMDDRRRKTFPAP